MPDRVQVQNVNVVDVAAEAVRYRQDVLIVNGRIAGIENHRGELPAQSIDATGLYLSPGLIDAHVHLFLDGGSLPRQTFLAATDQEKIELATRNASAALAQGITTVRDCGAPARLIFEFQRMVERREALAPHIMSAGSPLMRPGGHCHFMGGEVQTVADVRQTIESQLRRGAAFVKVMASGGGLTPGTHPGEADFSIELMHAAAETAHANGVQITAHCHATASILNAIDAGFDMIEHHSCVGPDGRYRFEKDVVTRTRDHGIVVAPTVISALRSAQSLRRSGRAINPDDLDAITRLEGRLLNARHFYEMDMKLIGGSDSGVTDTPFGSLIDEIICYRQIGMSAAAALRSVTSDNALHLCLPSVGQVKSGYRADLLLLRENPLADLETLRQPLAVILSGAVVSTAKPGALPGLQIQRQNSSETSRA